MDDELFEAMWKHTEHMILLTCQEVGSSEASRSFVTTKFRYFLREVMDAVSVPEHIDLVAFWAPVNMMIRDDEHQPIVVETMNICVTDPETYMVEDHPLMQVHYTGPVVEGIERILGSIEGDHTVGVYVLPLPVKTSDGRIGWRWRWAKRAGRGWKVPGPNDPLLFS
jgi:hypothetical protein